MCLPTSNPSVCGPLKITVIVILRQEGDKNARKERAKMMDEQKEGGDQKKLAVPLLVFTQRSVNYHRY